MYNALLHSRNFILNHSNRVMLSCVSCIVLKHKQIIIPGTKIFYSTEHTASKFVTPKKLLGKDNISLSYELIYRIKSVNFWTISHCFLYFCLLCSSVLTFFSFYRTKKPIYEEYDNKFLSNELTLFFLPEIENEIYIIFGFIFNIALYMLVCRLPLRIYFNGTNYIAVYLNAFCPFLRKNCKFTTTTKCTQIIFTFGSVFKLGNQRSRLFLENFRTPHDFYRMTGEISFAE